MAQIQLNQEQIGLRLDKMLCQKFDISFGVAQKLIREKKVKINGKRVDASYKIEAVDIVEVFGDVKNRTVTYEKKAKISPKKIQDFLASIIYEDDNIVAINKASGLAVQGGSGIELSIDDMLPYMPNAQGCQLVHRLDKDTSGILLLAKTKEAAEFLTKCFKERTIKKTYLALVKGVVKKEKGTINIALRKKFVGKNEKVYPDPESGKEAITNYKLLKKFLDYSLLELQPLTGRTHQLRVHCKEIGHAIINDVKYGGVGVFNRNLSERLCLHAWKIEFIDQNGKKILIEAPKPNFMKIKY